MKVIINGRFFSQRITGVQRFALEIVRELDKIVSDKNYELYIPKHCNVSLKLKNIKVKESNSIFNGILWDIFSYSSYVKREKGLSVNLCNGINLNKPSIVCIHDVTYKANPDFFSRTLKYKLKMLWNRFSYWFNTKHADFIITVSKFSKKEIMKYYHINQDRIFVINNAWQHVNRINDDKINLSSSYPFLSSGTYFFSMSTLEVNKNFRWVLNAAKNNPEYVFVIAGGGRLNEAANAIGFSNFVNVHFLGYITDEEAKSLIKNCKAFIFPSLYEGFGLPPIEAMGVGCKNIILSDIEVMHEIFGDSVSYIDPKKFDYKFQKQDFENHTNSYHEILDKYSWAKSAAELYALINRLK